MWISVLVVVGINTYSVLVLVEVARRADGSRKRLELPDRTWSLLQLALVLVAIVCAFGEIYIKTEGVVHLVEDAAPGKDKGEKAESSRREVLTSKLDACYFSIVTLTTLGYGDYVPATRPARVVVMWQLATGVLLLIVTLPLLVSRLATFG